MSPEFLTAGGLLLSAFAAWVALKLACGGPARAVNYLNEMVAAAGGICLVPALWIGAALDRHAFTVVQLALWLGALGLLDDAWGSGEFRGFGGHLRALRQRRITTGQIKAAGGLAGAIWIYLTAGVSPGLAISSAFLTALSANLLNLFDLRPLRAAKVSLFFLPFLFRFSLPLACSLAGALTVYLPSEARRRIMLGDTGANLLGAVCGAALAAQLNTRQIWSVILLLALLHGAAEIWGLSRLIGRSRILTRIDDWGR